MFEMKGKRLTALAVGVSMALSGCATVDNYVANTSEEGACAAGAVVFGVLAGGLAAANGASDKEIAGAAAGGAAAGCAVMYFYKQRVDRLQALAQQQGIEAQVSVIKAVDETGTSKRTVGVEAQFQANEMFESNSAVLTSDGYRQMSIMAQEFARSRDNQTGKKVLVVGHSDASGGAELNQKLSEKRAHALGQILAAQGIPKADIYFQGAGSARPVADNATAEGRAKNRRVEFVEVENEALLVQRVAAERNNTKYLAHGTSTKKAAAPMQKAGTASKPTVAAKPSVPVETQQKSHAEQVAAPAPAEQKVVRLDGKGGIDFGGHVVSSTTSAIAGSITPKSTGFALVQSAYAEPPMTSCLADMPRIEGEVKNLATGKSIRDHETTDYFPGLNGQIWAGTANGHVISIGPVAILRDSATVPVPPKAAFISDYATPSKKESADYQTIANTYEGETQVLYRVFSVDQRKSPVSCMDFVFDKRAGTGVAAEVFYPKKGDAYVAQFQPTRRT